MVQATDESAFRKMMRGSHAFSLPHRAIADSRILFRELMTQRELALSHHNKDQSLTGDRQVSLCLLVLRR